MVSMALFAESIAQERPPLLEYAGQNTGSRWFRATVIVEGASDALLAARRQVDHRRAWVLHGCSDAIDHTAPLGLHGSLLPHQPGRNMHILNSRVRGGPNGTKSSRPLGQLDRPEVGRLLL